MYSIDLRQQYSRVVGWNIKVGKLPLEVTYTDVLTQKALVDEEVAEFLVEVEAKSSRRNFLKELCDVFVTACYLDFLQLLEADEEVDLDTAADVMRGVWKDEDLEGMGLEDLHSAFEDVANLSSLKLVMASLTEAGVDVEGALDEVLNNNDLKVYESTSEADEQLLLLGEDSTYFVDANHQGGRDYFCIKRIEDGKVMKSSTHPDVDLTPFLGG